jgi:hypothetical protein
MEIWQIMWGLTAVVGLVAAGVVGSGFALVNGEPPGFAVFARRDALLLPRSLVLVIYAPLGLVRAAYEAAGVEPMFAVLVAALGLVWSFFQGVVILTTCFGFS